MKLRSWAVCWMALLLVYPIILDAADEPTALIQQADHARHSGDCRTAVRLYGQLLDNAPNLRRPHYNRAACFEKLGDLRQAAADYQALVDRFPADADALGNLGWVLFKLRQLGPAQQATARAQHLVPLDPTWATNLGDIQLALGNTHAARRWYREALRLIPDEDQFQRGPMTDLKMLQQPGWTVPAATTFQAWLEDQYPRYQPYREAGAQFRHGIELREQHEYSKALPALQEALRHWTALYGAHHVTVAAASIELATLYLDMNDSTHAQSLLKSSLRISEHTLGTAHPYTALSLERLGQVYDRMGEFTRAEQAYQRALDINTKVAGAKSPEVAVSLNNLSLVYQHTGAYPMAQSLAEQALEIKEATLGTEHPDTAISLSNLASIYDDMGSYARAEQLYQRELALSERIFVPTDGHTAASLNNLAHLYARMGAFEKAEPLYERALALQRAAGPEHPQTAISMNNLAELYRQMGDYARAEPLFQQSLALTEKIYPTDSLQVATVLGNLASCYEDMRAYAMAEPLYQRALALTERAFGRDQPGTEWTLNNLAHLYSALGAFSKAEPLYRRSLAIALRTDDPQARARVLSNLADLHAAEQHPQLAIFWGKQAVNILQGMRAELHSAQTSLRDSFVRLNDRSYAHLADVLIEQGRLPEAQEVLAMQKEREYTDYLRGDTGPAQASHADLSETERRWQVDYQRIADKLVALGEEQHALQQKPSPTPAERNRLDRIDSQLQAANEAFADALEQIQREADSMQSEHRASLESRNLGTSRLDLLSELNARTGGGAVLLQYVIVENSVRILLTTANVQKAFRVQVGEQDLNHDVQDLLMALRNPHSDPRPSAQRLFNYLIEPVRADLQSAQTRTLMLSLDGTLRYLPFAALYDGKRYLVERYATTIFNEAAAERLLHERRSSWRVAGLGLTQGREGGFSPLPGVRLELESIVHRPGQDGGILDGVIYLDSDFTRQALGEVLSANYPVLHVASHFHFAPAGGETDSFLLLGDGSQLTLADLRRHYRLPRVDLLALSACETAIGSGWGRTQNGHEVEGMATEAQNLGALSVLASMWPVVDASTAQIMAAFYAGHEHSGLNKAEALRQAQLLMMQTSGTAPEASRGASRIPSERERSTTPEAAAFRTDPAHPYAHPYYWAPFVLMGNWL